MTTRTATPIIKLNVEINVKLNVIPIYTTTRYQLCSYFANYKILSLKSKRIISIYKHVPSCRMSYSIHLYRICIVYCIGKPVKVRRLHVKNKKYNTDLTT